MSRVLLLLTLTLLLANTLLPAAAQSDGEIDEYIERVFSIEPLHLVGYWPLDGNAQDYSGNDHHGIASGVIWSTDGIGDGSGSAFFDGINDYIDCAGSAAWDYTPTAGTLFAWVRLADADDWTNGTSSYWLELRFSDNTQFRLWDYSSDWRVIGYGRYISVNPDYFVPAEEALAWNFMTFTWDDTAGLARLYWNGLEVDSGTYSYSHASLTFDLCRINYTLQHYGNIAHVGIYDEALSPTEVEILASVPPGPYVPEEPTTYQDLTLDSGQQARLWYEVSAGELLIAGMGFATLISQMIQFGVRRAN